MSKTAKASLPTPDLIRKVEMRYKQRKEAKKDYDSIITLNTVGLGDHSKVVKLATYEAGQKTVRLLDEGTIVSQDGYPLHYLKKGSIERFYDRLSPDYVGSINLGHMDFATFPFLIGQWTKADLKVVDIGDGRKGLDLRLNLDEDSLFVKELRRMKYTLGVSAELTWIINESETEEWGIDMIDDINIHDIGVVGEAGNVGSGEINLQGGTSLKTQTILDKFFSKHLSAEPKDQNAGEITPPVENDGDETKPEGDNTQTKPEGSESEPEGNNDNQENAEKNTAITDEDIQEMVEQFEQVAEENAQLKETQEKMLAVLEKIDAENEAKDARIAELQAKLSTKEAVQSKGLERFKELAAELNIEKNVTPEGVAHLKTAKNAMEANYGSSPDGMGDF